MEISNIVQLWSQLENSAERDVTCRRPPFFHCMVLSRSRRAIGQRNKVALKLLHMT
jgi:hypothetical protein